MNEITKFNFNDLEIRTIVKDNSPYFCLVDVCSILELSNPSKVASSLDPNDLTISYPIDSKGRKQETNFVNESGLYQKRYYKD